MTRRARRIEIDDQGRGNPRPCFLALPLVLHGPLERFVDVALGGRVGVGVDVYGDGAVGVTRKRLHDLGVHARPCPRCAWPGRRGGISGPPTPRR